MTETTSEGGDMRDMTSGSHGSHTDSRGTLEDELMNMYGYRRASAKTMKKLTQGAHVLIGWTMGSW